MKREIELMERENLKDMKEKGQWRKKGEKTRRMKTKSSTFGLDYDFPALCEFNDLTKRHSPHLNGCLFL